MKTVSTSLIMVLITTAVEIGTEKVNHANGIGKTMSKPKSDTATILNQN